MARINVYEGIESVCGDSVTRAVSNRYKAKDNYQVWRQTMTQWLKERLYVLATSLTIVASAVLYFYLLQDWALNLLVLAGSAVIIHRFCNTHLQKII